MCVASVCIVNCPHVHSAFSNLNCTLRRMTVWVYERTIFISFLGRRSTAIVQTSSSGLGITTVFHVLDICNIITVYHYLWGHQFFQQKWSVLGTSSLKAVAQQLGSIANSSVSFVLNRQLSVQSHLRSKQHLIYFNNVLTVIVHIYTFVYF